MVGPLSPAAAAGGGPALDSEGRLLDDVRCRQCRYDLRGLTLEAACPECGTRVGDSARPDLLRYADPRWRRRLRRGAMLMSVAAGLDFAWIIGCEVLLQSTGSQTMIWVMLWGEFPFLAVWLLACWMLTRAEPAAPRRLDIGRVAFALAIVEVAGSAVPPLGLATGYFWLYGPASNVLLAIDVAIGAILAVDAGRLARRVPDGRLASRHATAAVAMCVPAAVALGASLASWWLVAFPGSQPVPRLWEALWWAHLVFLALWVGAYAWWLYLLLRLRQLI